MVASHFGVHDPPDSNIRWPVHSTGSHGSRRCRLCVPQCPKLAHAAQGPSLLQEPCEHWRCPICRIANKPLRGNVETLHNAVNHHLRRFNLVRAVGQRRFHIQDYPVSSIDQVIRRIGKECTIVGGGSPARLRITQRNPPSMTSASASPFNASRYSRTALDDKTPDEFYYDNLLALPKAA